MTFLLSIMIISYLNIEHCSGRTESKHLMVQMKRHKPLIEKQQGFKGQDYQEGGTMSGEDDRNAGRNYTTMNVQQYRCSNCVIGTENNPFICTQCSLANSDELDGQFVCRRCRRGPARGQTFNCRRCSNSDPDNCEVTRVYTVITHSGFNFVSGPLRPICFWNC